MSKVTPPVDGRAAAAGHAASAPRLRAPPTGPARRPGTATQPPPPPRAPADARRPPREHARPSARQVLRTRRCVCERLVAGWGGPTCSLSREGLFRLFRRRGFGPRKPRRDPRPCDRRDPKLDGHVKGHPPPPRATGLGREAKASLAPEVQTPWSSGSFPRPRGQEPRERPTGTAHPAGSPGCRHLQSLSNVVGGPGIPPPPTAPSRVRRPPARPGLWQRTQDAAPSQAEAGGICGALLSPGEGGVFGA